jgi:hypothetical protein
VECWSRRIRCSLISVCSRNTLLLHLTIQSRYFISLFHLAISYCSARFPANISLRVIRQLYPNMNHTLPSFTDFLRSDITKCIGHRNERKSKSCGRPRSCSKPKPCNNPISKGDLKEANNIRHAIRSGANTTYVEQKLLELATLCLCKRRHRRQGAKLAKTWSMETTTRPSRSRNTFLRLQASLCPQASLRPQTELRPQARASAGLDRVFAEMNIMDVELDLHDRQMWDMAHRFRRNMSEHEEAQSVFGQVNTL